MSRQRPQRPSQARQRVVLILWGVLLVASVTWPFFAPGPLLWRDMAVPEHLGFIPENFGGGDLPARNAPQDGLLALFSLFAPAPWLAKALLIGSAGAAAWAGRSLATTAPLAAMAIAVLNPLVVERLLQGQWSLVIAAWMLPVIAATGLRGQRTRAWLAMWVAALTPTGGVFALVTGVACARGFRLWTGAVGVALCLPWLVPGLLGAFSAASAASAASDTATSSTIAAAVAAFAPRADFSTGNDALGTALSLLSLGGIWNGYAVPASRAAGFALCGVIVVGCVVAGCIAVGARRFTKQWWPVGLLAVAGWGLAAAAWWWPGHLSALITAFPSAGLFRDAQKLVMLAIPLCVVALGSLRGKWRWLAIVALVLQMPDYPAALHVLTPRAPEVNERLVANIGHTTAFFPQRPDLLAVDSGVAVDPYSKAVSMVRSGQLSVDGTLVDAPSPRWLAAQTAWEAGDVTRLGELGIGAVVVDENIVARPPAAAPLVPWILTTAWAAIPLLVIGAEALRRSRK